MSEQISITLNGAPTTVEAGTTGTTLFRDSATTVVMRVNGELWDLSRELPEDADVAPVDITEQDGLNVLRHSTAHVMAQAVQQLFPGSKLGIGPYITDGFYFDFDVENPFTPEDLKKIEKTMQKIINQAQTFEREVVDLDEAKRQMADEPYKLELLAGSGDAEGASVEVGGAEITIYHNVDRNGERVWADLCRGPHLPHTKLIANAFAVMRAAGAYWRGKETNPQLQRIYGTAWPTKDDLKAYKERLAEAERRDHRKLGRELDLFSFPEEIGSGLSVWHPKGGLVRGIMEQHARARHLESGYTYVYTPHISKADLFETSGHLANYKDDMWPAISMDEERDESGNITKQGQDYYLKPMNCPMHILIYKERGRSYRDLPLRLAENGTVYRNERSGALHGLTRVRGFTQDDSHLFVRPDQLEDEAAKVVEFVVSLLRDFGLEEFELELSMRDEEKSKWVGSDEYWDSATQALRNVALRSGLKLTEIPGEAAFYGPKIDLKVTDAIGRKWQLSTVQVDPNLPERFGLEYTAADGSRQRPIMIHRALFGSIERFFAILLEHYAGAFPAWLAPVQVRGIPVAEPFNDYLGEVIAKLRSRGVRAELDDSTERFPKKIRTASKDKIPFVLIAGGDDAEAGAVSFRFRDGSQDNQVPVDQAVERILAAIESHQNQ
ncbi:threonine--tRNA ligase [Nesterenkonia alkaliphila]|uniref:Threonine--tRNA ligase n=1 Tax=Nesterenkonia alkaliphila TaxID=1463631 RepID=A0A7K1UM42_9MICC|nr:threonine--tRNA ligase [Nesterenkonia alkaliphila]MVT27537.1 threonine--tRNA ligase [Nesterenkonia alkaliphila]GFZ80241.1 threonine--tRNA ligase [Nesterenkonia alkaliphila]